MTSKNLVNRSYVEQDLKCNLCTAVLFEPVECNKCNKRYCNDCFHKFFEAVKTCPNQCKWPTFTPVADKTRKRLSEYQFYNKDKEFGGKEIISYNEVV